MRPPTPFSSKNQSPFGPNRFIALCNPCYYNNINNIVAKLTKRWLTIYTEKINRKEAYMSKKIQKLTRLNNTESFLQVNLVKGYKYVDRAGEIVNKYHIKNKAPEFTMNLEGLVMVNPTEEIDTLKISSSILWAKFTKSDPLDMIKRSFIKESTLILSTIEVSEISRIGWRNFFVFDFEDDGQRNEALKKFQPIDQLLFESTSYKSKLLDKSLHVRLSKVTKNDESKKPALLFDIDTFISYEKPLQVTGLQKELDGFFSLFHSEEFLDLLNSVLN